MPRLPAATAAGLLVVSSTMSPCHRLTLRQAGEGVVCDEQLNQVAQAAEAGRQGPQPTPLEPQPHQAGQGTKVSRQLLQRVAHQVEGLEGKGEGWKWQQAMHQEP
jgi:hypothetical protein